MKILLNEEKLKKYLSENNFTLLDLSKKSKISYTLLSNLINGKYAIGPYLRNKIQRTTKLDWDELFIREG